MGLKSFLGKKFHQASVEYKQRRAAEAQIHQKAIAAGLREREKQQVRVAQEKERIRATKRIKAYKSTGSGFGSFLDYVSPPPTRTTTTRRKKKRKTTRRAPARTGYFDSGGGLF